MKTSSRKIMLMIVILALAALACSVPFFGRAEETPILATADSEAPPAEELAEPSLTSTQIGFSGETRVYSSDGIQITLPASYEIGDIEAQLANLLDKIQSLPEFGSGSIEQFYANNKEDILLWAYDAESAEGNQTHLLILKNEEFSGLPLGIVSTLAKTLLGDAIQVIEQERLILGDRDTLRFLISAEDAGSDQTQVIYLLKDSGKLWILGFLTTQGQIEQRLSAFDASVASFTVVDVD